MDRAADQSVSRHPAQDSVADQSSRGTCAYGEPTRCSFVTEIELLVGHNDSLGRMSVHDALLSDGFGNQVPAVGILNTVGKT